MNPDVVAAVDELVQKGVLERGSAVTLRRAASGSLVSLRDALRLLLWVGVLLVTTGVGVLLKQHLDRIGPVAIAIVIGSAAAACLGWAWRNETARSFAFDSVLLLGALLAAADLAFIELKFTPLGDAWPWHLLLVAAAYAALAFRFDSATIFSLSLTSFAAWRGVTLAGVATPWGRTADSDRLLLEALGCGLLFLVLGKLLERLRVKEHFEPAAAWLGWLLILGALVMRLGVKEGRLAADLALVGCGVVLAWFSWDERSLGRYALGIAGSALGLGDFAFRLVELTGGGEKASLTVVVLLATLVLVLVLRAHRALRASA